MKKMFQLEMKRCNLRPYTIACIIITISMIGLLYLFVFVPLLDPTDTDAEIFTSYHSLIKLHSVICMAIFAIFSAVMHSKITIEEYRGKQSILLFLYPVRRTKILDIKLFFVFGYTVVTMILSSFFVYLIFFVTESFFHICPDTLSVAFVGNCIATVIYNSIIAGMFGIISLWIGFYKKSVPTTIVASCIIVSLSSQILANPLGTSVLTLFFVMISIFLSAIAVRNLHYQVNKMEA